MMVIGDGGGHHDHCVVQGFWLGASQPPSPQFEDVGSFNEAFHIYLAKRWHISKKQFKIIQDQDPVDFQ